MMMFRRPSSKEGHQTSPTVPDLRRTRVDQLFNRVFGGSQGKIAGVRRGLLNGTSILSLLLCAATMVLWVRSSRIIWDLRTDNGDLRFISIERGGFSFVRIDNPRNYFHGVAFFNVSELVPPPQFSWAGFAANDSTRQGIRFVQLVVPQWLIALATAVLPAIWVLRAGRRLRASHPQCTVCLYNLTGNTSGVCPECGTAVAGNAGANA
jgi:hypothetical protein